MSRFKNFKTHKSMVQPQLIAAAGGNAFVTHTALSSEPGVTRRGVRKRQFYQAVVHSDNATTQTYIIKLWLVSGGTDYELDRVVLYPGGTHVWNDQDFGMDLSSGDYMKILWIVTTAVEADRLYLFMRTRDLF